MKLKRIPKSLNSNKIYLQVHKSGIVFIYQMDKAEKVKPYIRHTIDFNEEQASTTVGYITKEEYVDNFINQSDELDLYRFDNETEAREYFYKLKMIYKMSK